MSEQTPYEENQMPVNSSSVQEQIAFEPPKLNLQRLKTLQRFFQYAAGLLGLVFLILLLFSILELQSINSEIKLKQLKISNQEAEINSNEEKIRTKKDEYQALKNYVDIANKEITPETQKRIESNIPENVEQKQIPPRIYLHIVRQDQQSHAAAIGKELEANGFIVPGIERVKSIPKSDLRYFDINDIAKADIKKINSVLKIMIPPKELKNSGNIRPRHYEIWFGEDFPLSVK